MAKAFDATTKRLIEMHPKDWLALAGLPVGERVEVVDADLSTFTSAAAELIRAVGDRSYLANGELEAGAKVKLDRQTLLYNVLCSHLYDLDTMSVVVLLRPQALSPAVTGGVSRQPAPDCFLNFRYRLIRLWEHPVEAILAGGVGTLPLA